MSEYSDEKEPSRLMSIIGFLGMLYTKWELVLGGALLVLVLIVVGLCANPCHKDYAKPGDYTIIDLFGETP